MNEATQTDDLPEKDEFYMQEKILKKCYDLYADPKEGFRKIKNGFLYCCPTFAEPKKKITVLLIGDPSTGKSSFINWYVGEDVRKTAGGAASKRQKICLVTSGKRRQSLMGNATLRIFQLLCPISDITTDSPDHYLSTEILASNQKYFGPIAFVDTPGSPGLWCRDNEEDSIILKIGDVADLIFVFLDRNRQSSLYNDSLKLVYQLASNYENVNKMRFCLSKADEAKDESDGKRAITQIVEDLGRSDTLNIKASDIRTIYIPKLNKATECPNQIEELRYDIEETISRTIQITLDRLQSNCNQMSAFIERRLDADRADRKYNNCIFWWGLCAIVVMAFLVLWLNLSKMISHARTVYLILCLLCTTLVFISGSRMNPVMYPFRNVLSPDVVHHFTTNLSHVYKIVKRIHQLYSEYLKQSLSDDDFSNLIVDPYYFEKFSLRQLMRRFELQLFTDQPTS